MKRTISAILILCALLYSFRLPAVAAPEELYAQSAVLMDADSGRVLFEKNGHEVRPMASTTKILTCILILEQMQEGDTAEVSENAAAQPKVHLGVSAGEKYYVEDLLYSLMLESHNDAAVILAEYAAGSVEAFAERMNEKAKEIGCTESHFVTPNGLDAEDEGGAHATTAAELAEIMRYCITESPKREEFLTITRTKSYAFTDLEGRRAYSCVNHNAFLEMMEGALSGKTGFTGKAGYCYVGALERDGKTLIVALLACGWPNNKSYKWKDTRKLMEYGLENFEYRDVWKDISFPDIPVEDGIAEAGGLWEQAHVSLRMPEREEIRLLMGKDEEIRIESRCVKGLTAPVKGGQTAGYIRYYLDGELVREFPVKTAGSVEKRTVAWCGGEIWKRVGF